MTTILVDGRALRLTNLDKVLWPGVGFTKRQLVEYYAEIAPVLLPHLDGRPLTVRRFPDGVDGVNWHQNECRGEPDWFPVFETHGREGRGLRFCLVDGEAALVWLANQAAIELHPFTWRVEAPRVPTQLVFDLDPGSPAGLAATAAVALSLRDLLSELGLDAYVKGSGAARRPEEVVTEMRKDLRAGKVYVDWLQNDPTRQTIAPYSLRGLPLPTVAAPLTWDEVEQAARSKRDELLVVTVDDVHERLERYGDLFEPLRH